jgi:hypothetical protein
MGKINGATITWKNPVNYATGYSPSVALTVVLTVAETSGGTEYAVVTEVHQTDSGTGPLVYLLGTVGTGSLTTGVEFEPSINWLTKEPVPYAEAGCYPSVAMDSGGGVGEVHAPACGQAASPLLFSYGSYDDFNSSPF